MGRRNRRTGLSAVDRSQKKHIVRCWKQGTADSDIIFFVFILFVMQSRAAIKVPNIMKNDG